MATCLRLSLHTRCLSLLSPYRIGRTQKVKWPTRNQGYVQQQANYSSKSPKERSWFQYYVAAGLVGFGAYLFYFDTKTRLWQVKLYTWLPLNVLSRIWGKINNVDLPEWMREPVYKMYIKTFNVNMEEAAIGDLKYFKNLGEFFKRRIKFNYRPIDKTHSLTSPCDGKILHFGKVEDGWVEQVKGVMYQIHQFLGPSNWPCAKNGYTLKDISSSSSNAQDYEESLKSDKDKVLHHCVIYLAPGDYHGFHSPAEWKVSFRRHFPGKLLSVNPAVAKKVEGLFNFNERAVYIGQWEQGFLAMAAVGATNVGSIKVFFDESLCTNQPVKYPKGTLLEESFAKSDFEGVPFHKGEPFGEFNLGSTIVLIFEAPRTFKFHLEPGQKIKLGEPLGS